jgi:hypothetical protein
VIGRVVDVPDHVLDDLGVVAVDIISACLGNWELAVESSVEQAGLCHQYAFVGIDRLATTSDDDVRVTGVVEEDSLVPFGSSGHIADGRESGESCASRSVASWTS